MANTATLPRHSFIIRHFRLARGGQFDTNTCDRTAFAPPCGILCRETETVASSLSCDRKGGQLRFLVVGILTAAVAIILGCSPNSAYANNAQVFFAEIVRINLDRLSYSCEWTDAADVMTKPLFKDEGRIAAAHDGLEAALDANTPWPVEQAAFYTTGGLDIINAYASGNCPLAQTMIARSIVIYERIWPESYLAVSAIHDVVHVAPIATLGPTSAPLRRLPPELLEPDPVITRLEEQVGELEECARRHSATEYGSDYASAAAMLRGQLALSSKWPDDDQKGLLTFQMENANMMLINCNRGNFATPESR